MSGRNKLCSDGNRTVVNSAQECEKAAKYMKYEWKEERKRDKYPSGCYFLHDNSFIYYNFQYGQKNENAEQICKGQGK